MRQATAAAAASSAAVLNDKGEWVIKGTRRPDGTYRKDKIVKEGYIPQEEVQAFASKGTLCKPTSIPGLAPKAAVAEPASSSSRRSAKKAASAMAASTPDNGDNTADALKKESGDVAIDVSAPPTTEKQIRNLRKKMREIEELAKLFADNVTLKPTDDQQSKLAKKSEIQNAIVALEAHLDDPVKWHDRTGQDRTWYAAVKLVRESSVQCRIFGDRVPGYDRVYLLH